MDALKSKISVKSCTDRPDSVNIMVWNIHGLGNKLCEDDVQKLISNYDIVGFLETKKGIDFKTNYPGYKCYPFARLNRHDNAKSDSGGFLIMVSNRLKCVKVVQQTSEYVVWVKINFFVRGKAKMIHLGIVYVSPQYSTYKGKIDFFDSLSDELLDKSTHGHIALCGDFNARISSTDHTEYKLEDNTLFSNLSEFPRNTRDTKINIYGRKLLNICLQHNISILNGRNLPCTTQYTGDYTCYNHNGCSTVDYLIAGADTLEYIKDFRLLEMNANSDHRPLSFCFNLSLPKSTRNTTKRDKLIKYIWNPSRKAEYHNSLDSPKSIDMLNNFICSIGDRSTTHDEIINNFNEYLISAIRPIFKTSCARNINNTFPCNEWFDDDCKALKSDLNEAIRNQATPQEQCLIRKKYKQVVQSKKRQYQAQQATKLENLCNENPNNFWKYWKKLRRNTQTNDFIDIEKFTSYYKQTNKPVADVHFDDELMGKIAKAMDEFGDGENTICPDPINDILNGPIIIDEIRNALKHSKYKKACGHDGIPTEFLKQSDGRLDIALLSLFNYILHSGEYPSAWTTGLINPIHKQNDKELPENYRKITLLPSISKLFEYILNNRLSYCKEALKTDDPMQNGFKKDTPTTDNTFILNGIIEKQTSLKKPLYVCFVDFKSAFDLINRKALLYKMENQNIRGNFFKTIRSMLNNAKTRVKWDSELGEIIENTQGVLQGSVLSPSLFKLFLEDLPNYLNNDNGVIMGDMLISYILQADDLALVSETSAGLQKLIDGLQKFCNRWHILVNLVKTKVLIYNKKYITTREYDNFVFNSNMVEETDRYKYLGTLFTNKSNHFHDNTDFIKTKALRAIGDIKTNLGKIVGTNKSYYLFAKLFDTQVLPILEYGAEVWYSGKSIADLETVHLSFLKYVLGVKKQTSSLAIYGETGRVPLLLRQQDRVIKLYLRLINHQRDRPIYQVYNELNALHQLGHRTWVSRALNILNDIDVNSMPSNPKASFKVIKEIRYRSFTDKWLRDIKDSTSNPILRTYCKFKTTFGREAYLYKASNSRFMSSIARFRTSSHCLFIELGRHHRPPIPVNQRLCKFCTAEQIDDELHMLIQCTFHSNERNILQNELRPFPKFDIPLDYYSPEEFFCFILQQQDSPTVNYLGRFLSNGFIKRQIRRDAVLLIYIFLFYISYIALNTCLYIHTDLPVD